MNAQEQQTIARKLEAALGEAGVKVERVDVVMGNVRGWMPVPAEAIIGRWLQNGWRVTAL